MLDKLGPALPYIKNIIPAAVMLLFAYLVTMPLRAHHHAYTSESKKRSLLQFFLAVLHYISFSAAVLVPSLLFVYWLNKTGRLLDWEKYHNVWLSFWSINIIVCLSEGLFVETFNQINKPCPLTRLNRGLLHLAVMLGVGFMLIKYQLKIDIGVLLTSTAIVTGVIGFAMQGVLGNLLGGMSLNASRSISLGDWIEVDNTIGKVILVNWRETRLRTVGGHIIIIPNAKLADLTISNLSAPTRLRRHEVIVAASYGDAPGEVITALLEAAHDIEQVEKHPAPDAYVTGFKDFCIEYVLRFWSRQYERQTMIEGHVMRMVWYKFNRLGIEIPFPMSGRLLDNFMETARAHRLETPLKSDIKGNVNDLINSDFGKKLMADASGQCMLSREELESVAQHVKRTLFTRGETLMHQNEEGELFYILIKGRIHGRIKNTESKKDIEFYLEPGAIFGEMSLLTGLLRSATMIAAADCELLEFDKEAFTCLLSLREEIPAALSDLASARAKENAKSLEKLRKMSSVKPALARESILKRLKRMLRNR